MDLSHREKKGAGLVGLFIVCNPLYLVSTILILVGMTLVVWDEEFFVNYIDQVVFNVSSIQVYQICLVVAAVFLARRKVKYDSLLLTMLEFVFWLIPFVLLNCVLFSGQYEANGERGQLQWHVIIPMTLATVGLLAGRYLTLRRGYIKLDIGKWFLLRSLPIIVLNLLIPFIFRFSYDIEGEEMKEGLAVLLQAVTLTLVPVVFALPNLKSASPFRWPKLLERQPWIQFCAMMILAVMTVFHLEWVRFLYDLELSRIVYLPVFWVLVWTLWKRVNDYCVVNRALVRYWLLFAPAVVTPFLLSDRSKGMALIPVLGNCLIYGYLFVKRRYTNTAGRLAALSLTTIVVSILPNVQAVAPGVPGIEMSLAVILILGAVVALTVHNPFGGFFGALGTIGIVFKYAPTGDLAWSLSVSLGIGVFLLHSCLWRNDNEYWQRIRNAVAILASITTFILCAGSWLFLSLHIVIVAAVAVIWWALARLLYRRDLLFSLKLLAFTPFALVAKMIMELLDMGAYGPVVIVSAFVVFACGVWASLRKSKSNNYRLSDNKNRA